MSPSPEQIENNPGLDSLIQQNIDLESEITQIVDEAVPQGYRLIGFVFDPTEDDLSHTKLFVHPVIISEESMVTNWNRLLVLGGKNFSKKVVLANPECNNRNFNVIWTDDFVKTYVGGEFIASFSSGKPLLYDEDKEGDIFASGIIFLKNSTLGLPLLKRMRTSFQPIDSETTVIDNNHLLKAMLEGLNKASGKTPVEA